MGYGHEETIIQALGAALKGHHLTLEQAGSSNARASAPEAAILFYRVAARLDVEDILRQMKTLTGGERGKRFTSRTCIAT